MSGELILVAEDEEDLAVLTQYRLEKAGFQVVVASDGQEAFEAAVDRKPQLCILDMSMPELDGRQVLEKLRSNPDTANMKVIFMTGHDQKAAVEEALAAGAADYLIKPIDHDLLIRAVNAQLGNED